MKENMNENIHNHDHGPGRHGRHGSWHGEHQGHHMRGRRGGPGQHDEWQGFFGGWRGWFGGGPFGGPGSFGGHRERLERGLLRHVILSVIKDGPRHGYEIIKHVEEKTQGHYSPSPGTLYPTLQLLEDQKLVRSSEEDGRRVYHLTESGQEELQKQHNMVESFWSRFQDRIPSGSNLHELKFVHDAMKDLMRTVHGGLQSGAFRGDGDTARQIRQALERCQTEIREIMAQNAGKQSPTSQDEQAVES